MQNFEAVNRHHVIEAHEASLVVKENAEYVDRSGKVMKIISIEGDTVYYGRRGQCDFRPRKASIEQFKTLAGMPSPRAYLRLVAS